MINTNRKVIVLGKDHQNTLGVIRSLGEEYFYVIAIIFNINDGKKCSTIKSKYIKELHCLKTINEVIDIFRIIKKSNLEYRIPIIPCGDESCLYMDDYKEELSESFILPRINGGSFLKFMNKKEMFESVKSFGIPVPLFEYYEGLTEEERNEVFFNTVYPCIIKTIDSKIKQKEEIIVLKSINDYKRFMDRIEKCNAFIMQKFIKKEIEYGICGCRLNNKEMILGKVVKKIRFSQDSLGSTTAGIIEEAPKIIIDYSKKIVEKIDYYGIFDIEFIFDGNNYYFIEINFRNGAYGYAYTKAGRNYPSIWASESIGIDVNKLLVEKENTLFFINEIADFKNVLTKNESFARWFMDVIKADVRFFYNPNDIRPFISKLLNLKS